MLAESSTCSLDELDEYACVLMIIAPVVCGFLGKDMREEDMRKEDMREGDMREDDMREDDMREEDMREKDMYAGCLCVLVFVWYIHVSHPLDTYSRLNAADIIRR